MFRQLSSERRRERERGRSTWWKRTFDCFCFGPSRDAVREQRRATEVNAQRITALLSRPRNSPETRVATAVELVNELRRMQRTASAGSASNASRASHSHSQTTALFISLWMRELDGIIDTMSYEELRQAFGGLERRQCLSGRSIAALPSHEVSAAEAPQLGVCPVCLDEFQSHQMLRCLPACSHAFHAECIDGWLERKADCPVCRCKVSLPCAKPTFSSLPVDE